MGTTAELENIEATHREFNEKWGGLVAKKVAGVVAKEAVGYGIGKATKSPLLGFLATEAMLISDRQIADRGICFPRIFKFSVSRLYQGLTRFVFFPGAEFQAERRLFRSRPVPVRL